MITIVEEKKVLESLTFALLISSLKVTHILFIYNILARTEHTASPTTRGPCAQKERDRKYLKTAPITTTRINPFYYTDEGRDNEC